jgi:hypothetical protein
MGIVADYENCGSRSAFYVIDDKRGFKDFESQEDAEYAHYVQSKLAEHNLAPKVLSAVGKIRYRSDMELSPWGYITEIAEMIGCGGNECCCGECEGDLTFIYNDKIARLSKKIDHLGLEFMDAHIGNVGYVIRNGRRKLVCIDCGMESVYDPDADDNPIDDYCGCEQCKARKYQNV